MKTATSKNIQNLQEMVQAQQVKSSKRCRPVKVIPLESPMGNPQKDKDKDKDATDTPNTYVFDPNDV